MIKAAIMLCDSFSLANAYAFALAAQEAYKATPTIYVAPTDTAACLEFLPDRIVISFPGTRDVSDFWKDLQCLRVDRHLGDEVCGVHEGFDQAFTSIEPLLIQAIQAEFTPAKPIFCLGHSKGGALATRLAESLSTLGMKPTGVYTYGEPRGGDSLYANRCHRLFGDVHFRIEDEADCITRLPGWLAGNRHSGHDVFLTADGTYEIDPCLWFKIACDAWEIYQAKKRGPLALLELGTDHHIDNYVRRLKTLNGIS